MKYLSEIIMIVYINIFGIIISFLIIDNIAHLLIILLGATKRNHTTYNKGINQQTNDVIQHLKISFNN